MRAPAVAVPCQSLPPRSSCGAREVSFASTDSHSEPRFSPFLTLERRYFQDPRMSPASPEGRVGLSLRSPEDQAANDIHSAATMKTRTHRMHTAPS